MKLPHLILLTVSFLDNSLAFLIQSPSRRPTSLLTYSEDIDEYTNGDITNQQRRSILSILGGSVLASFPLIALAEEENMFAPKFVQEYSDFTKTSEGWSFREVKEGTGETPDWGDRVVFDWSGYTIGYFGRPFEAKGYVLCFIHGIFACHEEIGNRSRHR